MDGMPLLPMPEYRISQETMLQQTVKAPIGCTGTGLHTGRAVSVRLLPAAADTGIVFRRTDLGQSVAARFDGVVDTRLSTVVGTGEARVGTIEHLVAALVAAEIDNVVVELDGAEVPVMDGSAEPWLFLLACAGAMPLDRVRRSIQVLRAVRVQDGDAFAELRPAGLGQRGMMMALSIDFDAPAIGRQAFSLAVAPSSVRRELARARTFVQRHEIEGLQRAGLALGGSLDNAVVVDGECVLNPAGLRMADEFVRHKMLDAVGDLALSGAGFEARFVGHKSGHGLNNRLLRALFSDSANWRWAPAAEALLAA